MTKGSELQSERRHKVFGMTKICNDKENTIISEQIKIRFQTHKY